MSQEKPARKPLPALRLFEPSDGDMTGVEERLGFSTEESTMITSLERLEGRDSTGVEAIELDEELAIESPSDLSTSSLDIPASTPQAPATPLMAPSIATPPIATPSIAPPSIATPSVATPEVQAPALDFMSTHADRHDPHPSMHAMESALIIEPSQLPTDELPLESPSEQVADARSMFSEPPPLEEEPVVGYETNERAQGVMISSFNARGGVGNTSILLSLAGALQSRGFRVVVVDMDLQLATLASSLEVQLERSLAELVMESQRHHGPIQSAFDYHHSGVALVSQEERISEISNVTPERLPAFFSALRQGFDVVLVDGLRNFSDIAVSVMDESDMVLLSVTQDIPAVRSARKVLKLFARLGYEGGKARVVLNRFHKRAMISDEVIEEHLQCLISERLPNDFRFVSQGLAEGELLHMINSSHPFCLAIDRLAAQLMGFPAPTQRRGFLARLLSPLRRS